jgi:hypothetical protein
VRKSVADGKRNPVLNCTAARTLSLMTGSSRLPKYCAAELRK